MKRKLLKRGIAYLLTIAMVAGLVTYAPYPMTTVHAAEPSTTAYATKEQLKNWDYENTTGKIVFGKNSSGSPQEWYILGSDSGVSGDNTAIFAASPMATQKAFEDDYNNNKTYDTLFGAYASNTPSEVYPNHYGASDLRATLNGMMAGDNTAYFTSTEKALMNVTKIKTYDAMNSCYYKITDKIYALHGDFYNNDTILYAGSCNDEDGSYSKALSMSTYWNTGEFFWLRSPGDLNNVVALAASPGYYVTSYRVCDINAVQPASNLNLSSVIFASAAPAASSDTVAAGTIQTGTAMTLRLDGSNQNIGNVIYDSTQGEQIFVKKSADATGTVSLVVQGNDGSTDWYYSKAVTGGEIISMSDVKTALNLSSDISVNDCKIWMETTVDGVAYAKTVTNGTYTVISQLDLNIDAPVAGSPLDTQAETSQTGLVTSTPAVTWKKGEETVTGNADYNTVYTAYTTLKVSDSAIFTSNVTVNVNGNSATVVTNSDGTLTVSYTFPATSWNAPTVPTINIGTDNIIDPAIPSSTTDAWKGCYVYFGTYNGSPVKYRVLDSNTTVFSAEDAEGNKAETMLLDCDTILWAGTNEDGQSSAFDDASNVWADSNIRTYLNGTFLTGNFSTAEQNAIASSTKSAADSSDGNERDGYLSYVSLSGDKIFFLDAKEATNTTYGYSTDSYATNREKKGSNGYWWLRSSYVNGTTDVGFVNGLGALSNSYISNEIGVSPALNVNLSSVLFSSAIGTSKSFALTADSRQIGTTTNTEWKLTLSDDRKTVQITENKKVVTDANGIITVPYTYTEADATATSTSISEEERVNQISVMITDKAYTEDGAQILYYGALDNIKDTDGNDTTVADSTTGTGTFALPSTLTGTLGTDYHVYILAEHVNSDNTTDYASTPVEITSISTELSSVAIADIDTPSSGNVLDTSVTVSSNVTANVKWYLGDDEVTGNAGYNKVYTVEVTLTAKGGYVFATNTTVTLNGSDVTATKNADGTLTVSHTFDATGLGTIQYTSEGYEGTYDGQGHSITVDVSDPTDVTITYSTDEGDNKTYSPTNPTFKNAGEHTVYYKIEKSDYTTITGSQTVKIAKREITITADDQSIIWGSNISQVSNCADNITKGSLAEGDELTFTLVPSTRDLTTNGKISVGNVQITNGSDDSATPENVTDNYTVKTVDGKLTITHNTSLPPTAITATKETTTYIAGQNLNVDDITVTATYADGYSEKVTGYTTNADSIDMNTAGNKTLTISYTANGGTVTTDITITATSGYLVTLPITQTGYTITASTTEVLWNGEVTFIFTLADGYSKTDAFAVKVNRSEITLSDDGTYTMTGVKKALTVTVEGVADITAPTAEIKVKDNGWTQFWNTITFGIFFKDTQDVTITASDVNTGSGIDKTYYYISNEALTEDAVKGIDSASWTEYDDKFSINPDNTYVIYAKVVDKAGNTIYISTDGLALDGTAPVITGIEDNGIYYGKVTFSVTDICLDKVYVDDEEITLTDGKYTIQADDKAHTIKATDKSGNEVIYTITVKYGVIAYTATGADVTYDGKVHGITVSVTDPADAKITYSTDGVSYSETNPTFTDVNGNGVTVYYRIEKENYITVEGSETVKIGKKELTITAIDQTITYGDGIDTSKYTVSGLLDGHSINVVTLTPSTMDVTTDGTIAASIDKIVTAFGEDVTANYDVTYTSGKLVIEATDDEDDENDDIVEYEIIDGANSEWETDDEGNLTITGNGNYEDFVGVKVDGTFIDASAYTVQSGSTIVTLLNEYLQTLTEGEHTFEIVWTDGSASTTFKVKNVEDIKPDMPDTGDSSHLYLWILLFVGSGLTALGFWKKRKDIVEK